MKKLLTNVVIFLLKAELLTSCVKEPGTKETIDNEGMDFDKASAEKIEIMPEYTLDISLTAKDGNFLKSDSVLTLEDGKNI